MMPTPTESHDESARKRPPYRPPVGIPIRENGRAAGALISIALHVLIVALLLAPPYLIAREIDARNEGAGGEGPAGGGGGGTRGTGGDRNARERLRFIQVAPAPVAAPAPKEEPKPVPVVPKVEPPQAKPPEPAVPTLEVRPEMAATASSDPSKVAGVGGGSGNDGTAGSGPGSGGGVGSGIGTGRGSGNGPGTGGGDAQIFPPTVIALTILPIPVPSKVRPYTLVATFDVDTLGNATLLGFNPSKDGGYNRRIREMLSEIRFRPAVRGDGRPVRDTAQISAIAP
jgi:protein TonB